MSAFPFELVTSATKRCHVLLRVHAQQSVINIELANSQTNSHPNIIHQIRFDEITDLFIGRQSQLLVSEAFNNIDSDSCLTIRSYNSSNTEIDINFIAETPAIVDAAADQIQAALEHSGLQIDEAQAQAEQSNAQTNNQPPPQQQQPQAPVDQSANNDVLTDEATIEALQNGLSFTLLSFDPAVSSRIESTPTIVRLTEEMTTHSNKKQPIIHVGSSAFKLKNLTDFVLGCNSDSFQAWSSANELNAAQCVTFVISSTNRSMSFDLIADSPATLDVCLAGIQIALAKQGKLVEPMDESISSASGGGRLSIAPANPANKSIKSSHLPDENPVSFLNRGIPVTWFKRTSEQSGQLISSKLQLIIDQHTTGYVHLQQLGQANPAFVRLPIDDLTDVSVSLNSGTFALPFAAGAVLELCLTLGFKDGQSVDVQAVNDTHLQIALAAIQAVLEENECATEPQEHVANNQSGSRASRASFSVKRSVSTLTADEAVEMLQRGMTFDRYQSATSPASPERVCVWLNPSAGRFGSFFHSPVAQPRHESPDRCLAVHELAQVLVESKCPLHALLNQEGVISILAKNDKFSLHLAAVGGSNALRPFVDAIRVMLLSAGASVKASKNASAAASVARLAQRRSLKFIGQSSSVAVDFCLVNGVDLVCSIQGLANKERRIALKKVADIYTQGDLRLSIATKKQRWELEAVTMTARDSLVTDLKEAILGLGSRDLAAESNEEAPSTSQRRVSFIPSASRPPPPPRPQRQQQVMMNPVNEQGSAALASLTAGLEFLRHMDVDGIFFKQPVLLFYRQNHRRSQVQDALYWCDKQSGIDRTCPPLSDRQSCVIDEISDIFMGKQTARMQHPAAKNAPETKCVSLVGTNLELNLEAANENDVECLLAAVQYVCADGGRSINEASTPPAPVSTVSGDLSLLMKKAGSKRFSLGPARLNASGNRRLSTLPTRASMIACQESEDWILPSNLSIGHFQQPALLSAFYHALLSHAAASQAIESVLNMARDGRIFTGYTADSRGRWHASTLTLFIDADSNSLCWCPFGATKQRHDGQRIQFAKLDEIYLGKQSPALRCVLAAGANPLRCLSIVAGDRGIDIEARNDRTLLGFLFAMFVTMQRQGKTFTPGSAKHRMKVIALPKPSLPPPPPPNVPPKPAYASSGVEVEVVQRMEDGQVRLVPCKLLHSAQSVDAFSMAPPRSIVASVALNAIRDIYCGKATPLLSHVSLGGIKDDRCIAFVAKQHPGMELVMKDHKAVNALVDTTMKSLTSAGKMVFDSPPPPLPSLPPRKANKENAPVASSSNRRLSVMTGNVPPTPPPRNAVTTAVQANATRRASMMKTPVSNVLQFKCTWNDRRIPPSIVRMTIDAAAAKFSFANDTARFAVGLTEIVDVRAGFVNNQANCTVISLTGGRQLLLEAANPNEFSRAVTLVQSSLSRVGKNIVFLPQPKPSRPVPALPLTSGRRMSIRR